jgi:hypothetical protein
MISAFQDAPEISGTTIDAGWKVPTVTIARHLGGELLPLGLDQPLALLGGDALSPDRLLRGLMLDWAPPLQEQVFDACRDQALAFRPWFWMPPCVMSGDAGIGRTLMARSIARYAGVPFVTIHIGKAVGGERSTVRSPDIRYPSAVVLAMATARCANPVVLIEGIEDATDEVIGDMQAMVDPVSSPRWLEPSIGALVDLSHVTWLIRSSGPLGIPRALSHLQRVEIRLDEEARESRSLSIMAEVLPDLDVNITAFRGRGGTLLQPLHAAGFKHAKDMRKVAEKAALAASKVLS